MSDQNWKDRVSKITDPVDLLDELVKALSYLRD